MEKKIGRQTLRLSHPPAIISHANIGGRHEGRGPLAAYFDELSDDGFFGEKTWEKAESTMQKRVLSRALEKAGLSTMGESLALASLLLDGGFGHRTAAMTSSHFCTAERQYRMPVPYGSQRTPTAQWTATAAGCTILEAGGKGPVVTHVTCGTVEDLGITDANNMGAAMAPAALATLTAFFQDTGTKPSDYDQIVTGDLGQLGSEILQDLMEREGYPLGANYNDCGLLLFDRKRQDMHCGASGCGCSASVFNGYLLQQLENGTWKTLLFAPTGALLSPTSSFQGESIPGICHAVLIENKV